MKGKNEKLKYIGALGVLFFCIFMVFALNRQIDGMVKTTQMLPKIGVEPSYIEISEKAPFLQEYYANETMEIQALELLMLNTDGLSDNESAYLDILIYEEGNNDTALADMRVYMSDVKVGEWTSVGLSMNMDEDKTYFFEFKAHGCSPYFVKVSGYAFDISIGFDFVTDNTVTYGDAFVGVLPLVIILSACAIIYILTEGRIARDIADFMAGKRAQKIFNVLFLLVLYETLCLKIYQASYIDAVYISSDSDGYMREAVNLLNGNGFSYEGLAGYKSHFANWPIVYPALIAAAMALTGVNAYLASKIVVFIIVALIFITLGIAFKERAWIYSLAFTNAGYLTICCYAWSEVPFVLFMLLFVLEFSEIVKQESPDTRHYVLLTIWGSMSFLTRYFGVFLWSVVGIYWVIAAYHFINKRTAKRKVLFQKLISLFLSAASFGVLSALYLLMNRINNGYATGVSRGTWWDDYVSLTKDLIDSLFVEIFNVFSLNVPQFISELEPEMSVWVLFLVVAIIIFCVHTSKKKSRQGMIFIYTGKAYYVIFTVVRYRSSMDTFYYRFFAPATILLEIGLICIILENNYIKKRVLRVFAVFVLGLALIQCVGLVMQIPKWQGEASAYDITADDWNRQYELIPYRSVIIWNDMDYRSSWYRPDVYSGGLFADDTWVSLCERYYASEYICMKRSDAEAVCGDGSYDSSVTDKLMRAIAATDEQNKYIVMKLE